MEEIEHTNMIAGGVEAESAMKQTKKLIYQMTIITILWGIFLALLGFCLIENLISIF